MKEETYVALDLETTGTDPFKDKIIEIGMVKLKGEKIIDKFETLINPQKKVSPHVLAITGIKEEELTLAPLFHEVKEKIQDFVGNLPLVGHNIEFDLNFLKQEGLELKNPVYDTWHLSSIVLPHLSSHSLSYLTKKLNLEHLEEHRAFSDALASAHLFNFLKKHIKKLPPLLLEEIYSLGEKAEWFYKDLFAPPTIPKTQKEKKQLLNEINKIVPAPKTPQLREEFKKYIRVADLKKEDLKTLKEVFLAIQEKKKLFLESISSFEILFLALLYTAFSQNLKILLTVPDIKEAKELVKNLSRIAFLPESFNFLEPYNHYICPLRIRQLIDDLKQDKRKFSEEELRFLVKILLYSQTLKDASFSSYLTGVKSDLNLNFQENLLFSKINVPFANCWQNCPFDGCFYKEAIKKSQDSNLLIIPQSFLALKDQSDLKKRFSFLFVFDADSLQDETNFGLSFSFSYRDFIFLLEQIKEIFPQKSLVLEIEKTGDIFWGLLGILIKKENEKLGKQSSFLLFSEKLKTSKEFKDFQNIAIRFLNLLSELKAEIESSVKRRASFQEKIELLSLKEKIEKIIENLKIGIFQAKKSVLLTESEGIDWFFWGEIWGKDQILKFQKRPFSVKEKLEAIFEEKEGVVLISPALSVGKDFRFMKEQIGGANFEEKIILPSSSKDDFSFVVLENFPGDDDPYYKEEISSLLEEVASLYLKTAFVFQKGETLVEVFIQKAPFFREKNIDFILQEGGRLLARNIEHFKYTPLSFLLVLPNNVLKFLRQKPQSPLIFLEKLPFDPYLPIFQAQEEYLQDKFFEYSKMRAVLRFKKIVEIFRNQTPKGVIVLLNKNILAKDYGSTFLYSLYNFPFHVIKKEDLVLFLKQKLGKN